MASTEMRVPTLAICNKAEAVENVMMTRKIIDGVTCGRSSLPSAWGSNSNVIIQVIVMVIREISQMWRLTVATKSIATLSMQGVSQASSHLDKSID